ncbi:dihydrodipicolinate synthase family protein [Pedobacter sp. SYSU D00535]|uniref:dihydrodipicolinate synthase family protein n=1 Tax=Pedobacter sp. SYSU D00535 TaxID=2810308 RepID=UPI001A95808D|nr:dihydrodipicolinate synthase family protein [Pedobacter sp. SYSU D00535]
MNIKKKYQGVVVPVVTPVTNEFTLDEGAVERIFNNLYANNVSPFFLGTTGESASLPNTLKQDYLQLAGKLKKEGTMLYAGISSNCFEESVEFAKRCFDAGVDAVAATLPSYYPLTEAQMKKYFESLAEQIKGPLIIYNIPATTHMSIPLEVIDELSYHEYIVGTKDSERGESRLNESTSLWGNRADFSHFLGWAAKSAHALLNGSDGLIPSTGNLHPGLYSRMMMAALDSDQEQVFRYQYHSDLLGDLYQSGRTLGESLWALKVLMQEYGLCEPVVMPPLQPLSKVEEVRLRRGLHELIEREGIQINRPLANV